MIAPFAWVSGATVAMYMAGVVHRSQSNTSQSAAVMPRISAALSRGPEWRESRPTASVSRSVVVPSRSASHWANT